MTQGTHHSRPFGPRGRDFVEEGDMRGGGSGQRGGSGGGSRRKRRGRRKRRTLEDASTTQRARRSTPPARNLRRICPYLVPESRVQTVYFTTFLSEPATTICRTRRQSRRPSGCPPCSSRCSSEAPPSPPCCLETPHWASCKCLDNR